MTEWEVACGHLGGKFKIKADDCWISMNAHLNCDRVGHVQFHVFKSNHARSLARALIAAADQMDELAQRAPKS